MRAVQQTISHWGHVVPYAHVPHNEKEYEKLLDFVGELFGISPSVFFDIEN